MSHALSFLQFAATRIMLLSLSASGLILATLLLRQLLGRAISARWLCLLWLIVLARLFSPGFVTSRWNIETLWQSGLSALQAPVARLASTPQEYRDEVSVTYLTPEQNAGQTIAHQPEHARWKLILSIAWFCGALAFAIRLIGMHLQMRRRIATMQPVTEPRLLHCVELCRKELRLRRAVRIVRTGSLRTPAVFGIFRPVLLLPAIDHLSAADLRLVLLHELMHIHRGDLLFLQISRLLTCLHWFNPLVWLAHFAHRTDRELACDESVLSHIQKEEHHDYGLCIIRFVNRMSALPAPAASLGIFGGHHMISRRISRIAKYRASNFSWILGVFACLLVGCGALSHADSPTTQREAVSEAVPQNAQAETPRDPLDTPVESFNLQTLPLEAALNHTATLAHANLFVDWKCLEAAGIDRNVPISTKLEHTTVAGALKYILRDAGGGAVDLDYELADGVINISTAEQIQKRVVTRVYDVRDILVETPDFTPGPDAKAEPQAKPPTREELVEQVKTLICKTVAQQSWKDNGGLTGDITEHAGQLVITQTSRNHAEIAQLLTKLREGRSIQVVVEARIIKLDVNALPEKLDNAAFAPIGKDGGDIAYVDEAQAKAIMKQTQSQVNSTMITAPRITLFNGQRAFVKIAKTQGYISGYSVVKDGNATKFTPETSQVESGITFDVQATVSADRKYVAMTLRPTLSELLGIASVPFPDNKELSVQVPNVETQSLITTVSVPDRGNLLIRTAPSGPDKKQMVYMLIKPTVIEQKQN